MTRRSDMTMTAGSATLYTDREGREAARPTAKMTLHTAVRLRPASELGQDVKATRKNSTEESS